MSNDKELILTAVDRSPWVESVINYAAWISKTLDLPIKFLHTIDHASQPAPIDVTGAIGLGARADLLEELTKLEQTRSRLLIDKGELMLQAAEKQVTAQSVENFTSQQRHGTLSETLVELEQQIGVLVVGMNGEQSDGTKLETLIRALHKPILVVNSDFVAPQKIMLAYNGDEGSQKALDMVSHSKMTNGMECHVVYVGQENEEIKQLLTAASLSLKSNDVAVKTVCLSGKTEDALIQYRQANDIDMTVMGAFGHHKLRNMLLGSFTTRMLELTKKPLLLLR